MPPQYVENVRPPALGVNLVTNASVKPVEASDAWAAANVGKFVELVEPTTTALPD